MILLTILEKIILVHLLQRTLKKALNHRIMVALIKKCQHNNNNTIYNNNKFKESNCKNSNRNNNCSKCNNNSNLNNLNSLNSLNSLNNNNNSSNNMDFLVEMNLFRINN